MNVAKMDRPTFLALIELLSTEGYLKNSMFLSSAEKLVIFIHHLVMLQSCVVLASRCCLQVGEYSEIYFEKSRIIFILYLD
jgi:hypothetical protein